MPAIPERRRRRRHHRLGHRPASEGADQRRPRRHDGHHRRVDPGAHRHPGAPRRRHHRRAVGRGGTQRHRDGRGRPRRDRRARARHHHTRPHGPGARRRRSSRARPALRRVRRQRRLLRLHVRPGHRPRPHRHGRREDPRHRHRHAVADHRLGGPQHRDALRRRLRRGRAREGRGRWASCSAGTSTPTARPSASSTPRSAATSTWTAGRSSVGPCASWSTRRRSRWPTPASSADDIALVVPHQANIRIIEAACQRLGIPMERRPPCCSTPATPRRRRSRSRWPTRSTPVGCSEGDLLLLVGFGAGMTAASAVLRWGGVSSVSRVGPRHGGLAGHRPGLRPPLRRAGRQGGRHLPHARPRPTDLFGVPCDVTSR